MRALAVIGANYGDEGKGRTVDWLSAPLGAAAVVVRSNGGAQAGHTVLDANGERHVFHHFGSGSFRGAATHFSRFMVAHPILFAGERELLGRRGVALRVSADPRGQVTTPWDMMINQAIETARGGGRHGSCGLGFGETVGRSEETEFQLSVRDLGADDLHARLTAIRDAWFPGRAAALGVDSASPAFAFARSDALLEHFVDQCRAFSQLVELRDDADLVRAGTVIFEAAQGLLLDQRGEGFPFVTRSNTGLPNIAAIAAEAGITALDVHYVTRAYLTRHGRGPMEDERAIDRWYDVDDATNRPNPWQESLRFGLLDPARLAERVAADLASVAEAVMLRASLAVTCLDQARGPQMWRAGGGVDMGSAGALIGALEAATGLPLAIAFSSAANASPVQAKMRSSSMVGGRSS